MSNQWQNPEYARTFYHVSRHAELVVVEDRDVMAFIPESVTLDPTSGMAIYRDSSKNTLDHQSDPFIDVEVSERVLLWPERRGTTSSRISAGFHT